MSVGSRGGGSSRAPALVTGGAGFIGSNLVDRIARDGGRVRVLDSLARPGVEMNVEWLRRRHPERVEVVIADVRDMSAVTAAMRDVATVFHLAGQTAVTTSLVDPRADFEVNAQGTINVLEAARQKARRPAVIFASTNKVYGDLGDVELVQEQDGYAPVDAALRRYGVGESRPVDFHTPYGCSKGAADQYVLDYSRSFGLPTAVLRMSCIYGPRQLGTEDQGWVAHFARSALEGSPLTIYGDGLQVRDVLHVSDVVEAYVAAAERIEAISGRAFNLGGGPENVVSLRAVMAAIIELTGRPIASELAPWRAGDQRYYVSDTRRAAQELGLPRPRHWRDGLGDLIEWLSSMRREAPALAVAGGAA